MSEQCLQDLDYAQHPELAIVSLLYMMSRFQVARCGRMAQSILGHLWYVAHDQRYPETFREAAAQLYQEWQLMLAEPLGAEGAEGAPRPALN